MTGHVRCHFGQCTSTSARNCSENFNLQTRGPGLIRHAGLTVGDHSAFPKICAAVKTFNTTVLRHAHLLPAPLNRRYLCCWHDSCVFSWRSMGSDSIDSFKKVRKWGRIHFLIEQSILDDGNCGLSQIAPIGLLKHDRGGDAAPT